MGSPAGSCHHLCLLGESGVEPWGGDICGLSSFLSGSTLPSSFSYPFWYALRRPPQLPDSQLPLPRALTGAFISPHPGLEAPDKVLQKECVFPLFPYVYTNTAGPTLSRKQPSLERTASSGQILLSLMVLLRGSFSLARFQMDTELKYLVGCYLSCSSQCRDSCLGVTGLSCSLMSFCGRPGLKYVHSYAL